MSTHFDQNKLLALADKVLRVKPVKRKPILLPIERICMKVLHRELTEEERRALHLTRKKKR